MSIVLCFFAVDNVSGKKVHRKHHNQDFSLFLPAPTDAQPKISAQLAFAVYQFLSTGKPTFRSYLYFFCFT